MRTIGLVSILAASGCIPRLYGEIDVWQAPENGWALSEPPAGLTAEGWNVGQTPPDFRLVDQYGDTVSLWQFHGQVVLVDISTMWCAPCQDLATHTEETWLDYQDEGFVYATVLQQNNAGAPPTPEDIQLWVDYYGISAPVLEDGAEEPATGGAIQNGQFPAVLVVDRDMKVAERVDPVTDEEVRRAIEDVL